MRTLLLALLLAGCASQKAPSSGCREFTECVDLTTRLTGTPYLSQEGEVEGKVIIKGDLTWTKENADVLLGQILGDGGYARLPLIGSRGYKIINARDIRYHSQVPSYVANKRTNDPLPEEGTTADQASLTYTSEYGGLRVAEIARNLRPFMSRYGRVIDIKGPGLIILRDNIVTIKSLLPIIRAADTPVTKEEIKREKVKPRQVPIPDAGPVSPPTPGS